MRPVFTISAFIIMLAIFSLILPLADHFRTTTEDKVLPNLHNDDLKFMANVSLAIFNGLPLITFILLGIWLFTNTFNDRIYGGRF